MIRKAEAASASPLSRSGEVKGEDKDDSIQEIIVTAQKKSERLQDVPVPVTVVDTEALATSGAGRIQDYYATVPGLSLNSFGGSPSYLTLRGLSTTDGTGPTTAMVIDDVPFGASTAVNLGQFGYPDIDPSDLARIEVLKGPQGTLYGADSLGGLIKVVTQDPSTAAFSGHVQVLGEDVLDGAAGYGVRGSVNIPISDTLAVRASAFDRRDPGYIDNVTTGQDNVNSVDAYGARLGALWRPSDAISLKLGAMFQNTQGFGTALINANYLSQPTLGDLQQTFLPGTQRYNAQIQLYTATLIAKLGDVNFTSVSGYGIQKWFNVLDFSEYASQYLPPTSPSTTGDAQDFVLHKFSQEFRLSASVGAWLDWLAGAFYTHEYSPLHQSVNAIDPTTGAFVETLDDFGNTETFYEYAVFGDLTFHITDRFDIQAGGRRSWSHQTLVPTTTGANVPPNAPPQPAQYATGDAFTYLVTPEFKISPDLMVYARVATGYRIGGPNFNYGVSGVPASFKPDTTTNLDLGIKGEFFDHALTIDAAAYYIDWKDIQLGVANNSSLCPGGCYYQINGTRAKSEGVELSLTARPVQGTTVRASASYNNAVLTQNLPLAAINYGAYALSGYRLPYSVRDSGSLGVEQDVVRFSGATGFVGANVTYISSRYAEFAGAPPSPTTLPRLEYPGYASVNLQAGVRYAPWLFNLFANNVGDKRGIMGSQTCCSMTNPTATGAYLSVIQPRTVGLSVSRDF